MKGHQSQVPLDMCNKTTRKLFFQDDDIECDNPEFQIHTSDAFQDVSKVIVN